MAVVRNDVFEEHIYSIYRVKRIGVLGRTSVVIIYSEMPVLARATWRNIPEGILHIPRRGNLKS
jgi:hypothetical protein